MPSQLWTNWEKLSEMYFLSSIVVLYKTTTKLVDLQWNYRIRLVYV